MCEESARKIIVSLVNDDVKGSSERTKRDERISFETHAKVEEDKVVQRWWSRRRPPRDRNDDDNEETEEKESKQRRYGRR